MRILLLMGVITFGLIPALQAQNFGIGTVNPSEKLHVAGANATARIEGLSGTQPSLVQSSPAGVLQRFDFSGQATDVLLGDGTWGALPPSAWQLLGNAATDPATNFVGTIDAQALAFRTNNVEQVRILTNGLVGIGTVNPSEKLHVAGANATARLEGLSGTQPSLVQSNTDGVLQRFNFSGQATDVLRGDGTWGSLPPSSGWQLLGNAGTNPTDNFVGTTDAQDLALRTNNLERVRIASASGFVGIGQTAPTAPLHVSTPTSTNSFSFQSGGGTTLTNFNVVSGIYSQTPVSIPTPTAQPLTFHAAVLGRTPDTTANSIFVPAAGVMAYTRDYARKLVGFAHYGPNTPTLRFNRVGISNLQSILLNTSGSGPGWYVEDYGNLLGVNMFYDGNTYYRANQCMGAVGLTMFAGNGQALARGQTPYFGFMFHPEGTSACNLPINYTPTEAVRITAWYPSGHPGPVEYRMGINTTTPDQALTVNGDASKVGGGMWQTISDARLKTDIRPFEPGIEAIRQIQTVHYRYASDNPLNIPSGRPHIGFVAQDVARALPDAVREGEHGYLTLNPDPIFAALINAVKTLDDQVQRDLVALVTEMRTLRTEVDSLRNDLKACQLGSVSPTAAAR